MLVDFYREYGPSRFGIKDKRTLQRKIHEFGLPVIDAAHQSCLINPEQGDLALERHARPIGDRSPRLRGRPRKIAARDFDEEPAVPLTAAPSPKE